MSRKQLAALFQINRSSIDAYLSGRRTPTYKVIYKIVKALDNEPGFAIRFDCNEFFH